MSSLVSAFDCKGVVFPLTVFRLREARIEEVEAELARTLDASPHFLRDTPLMIDLEALGEVGADLDLPKLVRILAEHGLLPVMLKGGTAEQNALAGSLRLGVYVEKERAAGAAPALPRKKNAADEPLILSKPLRSGQTAYARGRDLIVLASVNAGSEALADGDIHVYGALRGRALAGAQGNEGARIYCGQMRAELVSIAGTYVLSEDIDPDVFGRKSHVRLENERLRFAAAE